MTREELIAYVGAAVSAVAETDGWAPKSSLYMMCGMEMEKWSLLETVLSKAGLMTFTAEVARITPAGLELAAKVDRALEDRKGMK